MDTIIHKETAVQDTELQYRVIFENTLEGMEIIDAETRRVVTANQAMADIFGFASPKEMIGLNPLDYISTEDKDWVARMIDEDMFQNNLRLVIELRAMTRDGREIWIGALGVRIEYQGRLAGLISVRDITAQKLRERKIEASKEETRLLVENAGKAIVVVQDGVIRFANSKVMEITGYSDKEMISSPFTEFIHPDDQQTVAELYLRSLRGEEIPQGSIVRSIDKEGNVIWFGLKAVSFTWEEKPAVWILMNDITKRRKAQQEVEQSEKKYRQLVEAINEGIWAIDKDSNTTFVNPRMAEMLGYTVDEMVGRHLFAFMDERGVEVAKYNLERCQQGIREQHDFEFLRKDGTWIHARLETLPIVDDKGDYAGTLAVARDITERKKAQQELEQSEKKYRLITENVTDIIWITDMNFRPTYVSPSVTRLLGYSVEEAMAATLETRLTSTSLNKAAETMARALASQKPAEQDAIVSQPLELEMKHKDGSTVWASVNLGFIRDCDGRPVEIMGVLHDITGHKQAEESLRETHDYLNNLLDYANAPIIVWDPAFRITRFNNAFERLTGRMAEEVLGQEVGILLPADQREESLAHIRRTTTEGEHWDSIEVPILRTDGNVQTVLWNSANIYASDGKTLIATIAQGQDITERKKVEQALAESEKRYRFLAENGADVIWVIDMNLRLTYLSSSITKMTGYSVEENMARGMGKSLDPASIEAVSEIVMRELAKKGEPNTATPLTPVAVQIEHKDGSKIWAESAGTLLRGSDGQPVEIIGILRDVTEHKEAEETLQRREQRFRALTEHSSDVILIVSAEGTVRYMSPSVEPVLGFNPEEAIGTNIVDYIQQETIRLVADDYARLLQNPGATMQTEIRVQHKDGTWRTLEGTATNLLHDPAVEGIVVNYRDITERKKAEESMQESERRSRLLAGSAADVIWVTDMNLRPTYVSPSVTRLLGYSVNEAMAGGMEQGLTPASLEAAVADFVTALAEKGESNKATELPPQELEVKRKDGSIVCAEVRSILVRDSDGQPVEIIGVLHDITERKRAEEAIKDSEARYRLLAENLSDVVWTMDTNLRYSYISPSVTHLRGCTVEEAKTISMEEMMTPASLEAAMRIMAEEDAREHTGQYDPNRTVTMEVELCRKDGSTVWAENAVTYLRDSNGQITGYLGVSRDITERREATNRLEQSLRKLERTVDGTIQAIALTVESRDRFTAGHQRRVAQLGCAIAQEMGFTSEQIQAIRIAGLLHDIGKISVPQEILSKPGKLTDIEFQLIKVHSQVGYDILKTVEFPWPIADIVIQHHERMNGSGYPSGIREDKLLIEARILGVSDVVEAMSSHRPYRVAPGVDKALEEISRNSGILYDPNVVHACLRVFTEKGFKFED